MTPPGGRGRGRCNILFLDLVLEEGDTYDGEFFC